MTVSGQPACLYNNNITLYDAISRHSIITNPKKDRCPGQGSQEFFKADDVLKNFFCRGGEAGNHTTSDHKAGFVIDMRINLLHGWLNIELSFYCQEISAFNDNKS